MRGGESVLDMGCGAGVAGLCVLARVGDASAVLVDRDEAAVALARENAARNGLGARARVLAHDIEARGGVAACGLEQGRIDHVIANPPFFQEGTQRPTPDAGRRAAHVAGASRAASLERWAAFAAGALRKGGSLTMIHRADALGEVVAALEGRFGGIAVLPVHPRPGLDAIRVIVTAHKASRAPMSIAPGLFLHDAAGEGFQPRVEAVLRAPCAL